MNSAVCLWPKFTLRLYLSITIREENILTMQEADSSSLFCRSDNLLPCWHTRMDIKMTRFLSTNIFLSKEELLNNGENYLQQLSCP